MSVDQFNLNPQIPPSPSRSFQQQTQAQPLNLSNSAVNPSPTAFPQNFNQTAPKSAFSAPPQTNHVPQPGQQQTPNLQSMNAQQLAYYKTMYANFYNFYANQTAAAAAARASFQGQPMSSPHNKFSPNLMKPVVSSPYSTTRASVNNIHPQQQQAKQSMIAQNFNRIANFQSKHTPPPNKPQAPQKLTPTKSGSPNQSINTALASKLFTVSGETTTFPQSNTPQKQQLIQNVVNKNVFSNSNSKPQKSIQSPKKQITTSNPTTKNNQTKNEIEKNVKRDQIQKNLAKKQYSSQQTYTNNSNSYHKSQEKMRYSSPVSRKSLDTTSTYSTKSCSSSDSEPDIRHPRKNPKETVKLKKIDQSAEAIRKNWLKNDEKSDEFAKKRNERMQRFNSESSLNNPNKPKYINFCFERKASNQNSKNSPSTNKSDFIGTCQDLEKSYYRISGDSLPDPATVRPRHVLEASLKYVVNKWRQNPDYTYSCDQLKAIRQDLALQKINDQLTLDSYEVHARLALENGDLTEFNQCQHQLLVLYDKFGPNLKKKDDKYEFLAYFIIYSLISKSNMDICQILPRLKRIISSKQHETLCFSYQVLKNYYQMDYAQIFRMGDEAPLMSGYLMDILIEKIRISMLTKIISSYKPNISVDFIWNSLFFEDKTSTLEFLKGQSYIAYETDHDQELINCRQSFANFNAG